MSDPLSSTENKSETPVQNVEFDKHTIIHKCSLPKEVKEVTQSNVRETLFCSSLEFLLEIFDVVLSWNTEHAALVTQTHCFAWSYSSVEKQPFDTPVYKFKMPICDDDDFLDDLNNHHQLPLVCIIPSNQSQRPGLLVCSRKGEFRYWEDITRDSLFEDHYLSLKVYLREEDFGTHLACHETHQSSQDTCIIIFGSLQSVLYRINISKMGASTILHPTSLSRSVGIMENFSSYLWLTSKYDTGNIIASTLGNRLENNLLSEMYVLMDKSLEKWVFGNVRSANKYIQGQDIYNNIIQEIYLNDSRVKKTDQMDLSLLDIEFACTEEIQYSDAVIYKNFSFGSPAHLIMPNGGPAVFVVFPQLIIMTTIFKDVSYNGIVSMSDPVGDRIIGCCGEGSKSWHNKNIDSVSRIDLLTAKTGIMTCVLNHAMIVEKNPHTQMFDDQMNLDKPEEMKTRELKRMFEQAIFNTSDKVPVTNYISRGHGGDINAVTLEISDEIMDSRSQYLTEFIELKSQINERFNKMAFLVQVIKFSNMLNELYPSTRQHLFWNAEKMACALKLWEYYNASLSSKNKTDESRRKLLFNAIREYLQERKIEIKPNEDIARFFFRFHAKISKCLLQEDSSILVPEANNIILLSFEAAFNFRRNNKDLYVITSNCLKESWTFHPELLKVLHQQFVKTTDIIQSSDIQGDCEKIESLKDHLVNLADILLGATSERLNCDDSITRESAQKYRNEWTTILKSLVDVGKSDSALSLSETYEEYKILVDLIMYHGQGINKYIKKYIIKYQEKFEYPLYEWYIERELYADLLSQPHAYEYKDSLQKFLNERNLKGISWTHDIYLSQYGDASIKLRQLAKGQPRVDRSKTFLSISKLTFLAELGDEIDFKNEDVQRNLEEIENGFELLNAYSDLQDQFVKFIVTQSQHYSKESEQVDAIMEGTAGSWKNYKPGLAQIYKMQVTKILQGEKVSTSGLVEVLTLKDKKLSDDFPFALQFTLNDNKLPEDHRRAILQTIWRRIYFNDNWEILLDTSDMSDEEVNERIKSTYVYHALNIVSHSVDIPLLQWFYPPGEAFFSSTVEQFHRWFPFMNEEEIKCLIEDYRKENDTLNQFIEKYHLNTYVDYALKLL
ncbi:15106_t:CDS:10 [Funneliformis geosporum]|uniref:15106_t:CDS:1 n=1 Tax=Funneliformis geosporum TaxID=1117311 RepID=A0A9W4WRZ6_9GLOM|nr:15106_t:CDS:10 [Funneliformis geosporum]